MRRVSRWNCRVRCSQPQWRVGVRRRGTCSAEAWSKTRSSFARHSLLQGREEGEKGAGEGVMRHQELLPALALDGRFFAGAAAAFCATIFLWPTIAMPPLPPLADPPRPTLLEGGTGFLEPRIILARMRGRRGPRDYPLRSRSSPPDLSAPLMNPPVVFFQIFFKRFSCFMVKLKAKMSKAKIG